MQEISYRELQERQMGREVVDRLVGEECPQLQQAFDSRRSRILKRMEEGEVEDVQIKETYRIGRNDPCPCGSKVKFKKCCGSRLSPNDTRIKD